MAAGLGFKTFVTGDVLTAADTNGYLMQGTWVFADAAARTAAVTSPQEGNMSYLKDTNSVEYYSGSAWTAVAGASGSLTLISTTNITATTTQTVSSIPTTYKHLFVYIENFYNTTGQLAYMRCNSDTTGSAHRFFRINSAASTIANYNADTKIEWGTNGFQQNAAITIYNYGSAYYKPIQITSAGADQSAFTAGEYKSASTVTSLYFDYAGTATAQGTIKVYGVN
jgi:hypothetical protein